MHLNPAFAGNTYAPLIHLNSRVQWPSINLAFNTVAFSYDQYFKDYRSGLGVSLSNDNAGNGILNTLRLEGIYSYSLKIKYEHYIKMGLGIALVQKRLNWEKLIFPDQLNPGYGIEDPFGNPNYSEELAPDRLNLYYPDISVGLLYYSPDFYLGFSLGHANNPEETFLAFGGEEENGLTNRFAVQSGAQFDLPFRFRNHRTYINPGIIYVKQSNLNQITGNVLVDLGMIYAGMGYRHAIDNPDALLMNVGVEIGMYKIGYSYDLTVSRLSVLSGGTHELGMIINFDHSEWFEKPNRYSDCFEIFR